MDLEKTKEFISKLNLRTEDLSMKEEYERVCLKYHDVFSKTPDDLGRCSYISHEIKLKDPTGDPVHVKQFPIPLAHREAIHGWVDKLLAQGAVELSRSAYNSPIFCVPKKEEKKLRIVQDFRGINAASLPDRFTIRDPRECIDEIGQDASKVFSAIDLTSGFWQQNLSEESRGFTAFTIPGKGGSKYQWTVNPMGLQGAPASFARLIDFIFRGLAHVLAYIDDILIHTRDDKDQVEALDKVFLMMRKYGLKINQRKSVFGVRTLEYLGYHVSGQGISPGTEKMNAMRKFPEPNNNKKIREFLAVANYFRFLIPKFNDLSGPLSRLTKDDGYYDKGPLPVEAANAFRLLKAALCSKPVVMQPALDGEWHVTTDASQGDDKNPGGLGAVLTQVVDGVERVIAYASRGLKSFEKNYSAYLLELQAAVWAIDYWSVYLMGRHFILNTDHKPLTFLSTIHKKTLNRLQIQLLEHDFEIRYKIDR